MKKILFLGTLIVLMCITACSDESVQDTQQINPFEGTPVSSEASIEIITDVDQALLEIDESHELDHDQVMTRSSTKYYYPSPNGGQCGKTSYLFYLKDYGNDPQRALRLQLPGGSTIHLNLYRWNDYQYISLKSYNCGDIFWTMVEKDTQQPLIGEYKLKNTGVSIATNATSKLGWPFKNDGSSWQDKDGWHIAYGSTAHINEDQYAQDWNKGIGYDDLGAKVTAPFCGQVVSAGWLGNCYGNTVDIVHYAGNTKVMHRVAHLDEVDVSLGQWVERAQLIGTLGDSGSSTCSKGPWTPHAHCVLYELDANESIVTGLQYNYSY